METRIWYRLSECHCFFTTGFLGDESFQCFKESQVLFKKKVIAGTDRFNCQRAEDVSQRMQ